jgi:hypothetical protein
MASASTRRGRARPEPVRSLFVKLTPEYISLRWAYLSIMTRVAGIAKRPNTVIYAIAEYFYGVNLEPVGAAPSSVGGRTGRARSRVENLRHVKGGYLLLRRRRTNVCCEFVPVHKVNAVLKRHGRLDLHFAGIAN